MAERCLRCRMHVPRCLCDLIPELDLQTRLALVMHYREVGKPTATGHLGLAALCNSQLYIHGKRDAPLNLSHLQSADRRVLVLFPYEGARELSSSLLEEDLRPVTLVVPDGNWRQASRIPKRVPGLEGAEFVTLPAGSPSSWGVRRETKLRGLATFEAIARAFGVLESKEIQDRLELLFGEMVERTFAARGYSAPSEVVSEEGNTPYKNDFPIIYQDEYLVAINKPSGVSVHRGWAKEGAPILQRLRDQLGRYVYPIHRLDRGTSGVLLFALTSEVASDMQLYFHENRIEKRYLALCRGHDESLGRVDHALANNKGGEKFPAGTDFRLLGSFERYGLYEALPRTGRTHQIRRHLKHASHPIIGDVRYGKGEHNKIFRKRFGFHRMALHCNWVEFKHPRTREGFRIEAPLSGDFEVLLKRLGLGTAW